MTKAHHLAAHKPKAQVKNLPLNFLLGCSQASLVNFELARLNEVANLRSELHAILDRMIDAMSEAALAAWLKSQDRETLKSAIENEEDAVAWAKRMIRESRHQGDALIPRTILTPRRAHIAAGLRYKERNVAEGKCSVCPKPLDRNSVCYCTKHLGIARNRARQRKGLSDPGSLEYLYSGELPERTHGRQPGTLASLAMNREKKTRAVLADLGISPDSAAAVSLKAAVEALLKCMPGRKSLVSRYRRR